MFKHNSDNSIRPMRSRVRGMKHFLNKHIEQEDHYGKMEVYKGTLHWWLLDPKGKRTHYTEFNSHAQSGAIFQNEMYDIATMQSHRSRMQKFNLQEVTPPLCPMTLTSELCCTNYLVAPLNILRLKITLWMIVMRWLSPSLRG